MKKSLFGLEVFWVLAILAAAGCGGSGGVGGGTSVPSSRDDTNIPIITSTYPQNLEANVPVTATICIYFNVFMDSTTIDIDTVRVIDGFGNRVPGTVIYMDYIGDPVAFFTPLSPLTESTRYTVLLRTGIRDSNGNLLGSCSWSFTTTDNMEVPSIMSTLPTDGTLGVSNQSAISVTFSEFMDNPSVNAGTFRIRDGAGNPVEGTISFNGMTVVFTPSVLLASSATYTAEVTTGAKDLYGNSTASDYSWSFTTTEVPLVHLIYPANGETAAPTDGTIIVGFSVTINYACINSMNFLVRDSHGNPVAITVLYDQSMATKVYLRPDADLAYEEEYTVTVTAQVQDSFGKILGRDYSWSFTTGPDGKGSWAPLSSINAPTDRSDASVVWTGTEMLVWGGYNGTNHVNTGVRYNPATDTWQPISMTGAPPAIFPQAVWTGTEMLVWGGGAGGRYNPATDTWQPISSTNAPAVNSPTAVWTGTEMILWGGNNWGGVYSSKGARYDPLTDQWTPTSTIGAPAARGGHTAVWTGTEMIVWGGFSNLNSPDVGQTGGRYNPATDTWLQTATQSAPAGRGAHTTVWRGSEMIIWGGYSISLGLNTNTGGGYDPSADSWRATSVSGAPSPRRDPVAIWTGTEMIIWGGSDSNGSYLHTGGLYDPVMNTWVPTAQTGAPAATYGAKAIWTGTEMIIWGYSVSSSGRYRP